MGYKYAGRLNKTKNNQDGKGTTPQEELIKGFARSADLSITDAQSLMAGNTTGLAENKIAAFGEAAASEYGDMETLQIVYDSLDAPEL